MIHYDRLESSLEQYAKQFREAYPFPHLVVDGFLEEEVAWQAFREFPPMEKMDKLRDFRQFKAQDPKISKFHPIFHEIIFNHIQSPRMLAIAAAISGIADLRTDPQLYAAGLAQGADQSFLNVHIDNSSHPKEPWYRRVNILVYLNPYWSEEKGGHLELWSPDMKESVAILPSFNRMAMFATSQQSWHGHRRVNTPDGDTRKSINIYYFSESSPTGSDYYHVTSFRGRANEIGNKVLYPVDNFVRTVARWVRPQKDAHAVLFDQQKSIEK